MRVPEKKDTDTVQDTAQLTAEILGVQTDNVLVASTGVIGRQLPMDKIKEE